MEHIAIYHDDPKVTDSNKLRTDICLTIKKKALPQGEIGIKEIRGCKFAMFLYKGTYNNPDKTHPDKLKTEIYVPIE